MPSNAPAARTLPKLPARIERAVSTIVIHCSASPSGQWIGPSLFIDSASVIDAWHRARGFHRSLGARALFNARLGSIGYHYVVDLDGMLWTGRHLDEVGAHVLGHNANSIGICLVGGKEREAAYTNAQWVVLAQLVEQLQAAIAGTRVVGHRDLSPDANGDGRLQSFEWLKTCPGFDVAQWLAGGMAPLAGHICQEPGNA
jgi:N-acetylmuramoyl-L-alanine amidase